MKTKREMRQEAIKRLNEMYETGPYTTQDIVVALAGSSGWVGRIIDLLTDDDKLTEDDYLELLRDAVGDYREEQKSAKLWHKISCDKDRYINLDTMTLPRDADGEAIHVGAEICGYGYPHGGVRCKAIINERLILAGTDDESYHEWLMWDAGSCRHYHKPTVEDLLVDYYKECQFHTSELGFVTDEDKERAWRDIATTFAAKLWEVMAE